MATAVALIAVGVSPAAAGTVRVDYRCAVELMVVPATYDVTVTAPATATRGQTVTITAKVTALNPDSDGAAPGDYRMRLTVNLGGASTGTLTFDMSNPTIPPGTPWYVTGTAPITFGTAGTVSFQPGNFASRTVFYSCVPVNQAAVPAAASTRVS